MNHLPNTYMEAEFGNRKRAHDDSQKIELLPLKINVNLRLLFFFHGVAETGAQQIHKVYSQVLTAPVTEES